MKKLHLIDYILIVEALVFIVEMVAIINMPPAKCIESLDVTKGQNFNQPILTEHNCKAGEIPTNWRNFEPKGN